MDSLYSEPIAKLILSHVARYAKGVGGCSEDVAALIRGFNPLAHHEFSEAVKELDRFVGSLDAESEEVRLLPGLLQDVLSNAAIGIPEWSGIEKRILEQINAAGQECVSRNGTEVEGVVRQPRSTTGDTYAALESATTVLAAPIESAGQPNPAALEPAPCGSPLESAGEGQRESAVVVTVPGKTAAEAIADQPCISYHPAARDEGEVVKRLRQWISILHDEGQHNPLFIKVLDDALALLSRERQVPDMHVAIEDSEYACYLLAAAPTPPEGKNHV